MTTCLFYVSVDHSRLHTPFLVYQLSGYCKRFSDNTLTFQTLDFVELEANGRLQARLNERVYQWPAAAILKA